MVFRVALPVLVLSLFILSACTDGSLSPMNGSAPVTLSAAFTTSGTPASLGKGMGTLAADSIQIDSALVVFSKIEFESETHQSDSSGVHEMESEVSFYGPFMLHVRNSDPIVFTSKILPAGTYTSIKFELHRLRSDDHHYDSDDDHHEYMPSTTSPYLGSSLVVWGQVMNGLTWTPFTFESNVEAEYRVRGTFVVDETIQTIPVTLSFNMGSWFVDPTTGELLDPSDTSSTNRYRIEAAIRNAFGNGECGRDDNHDGYPDDGMSPHMGR